jgi:hypothetical protein
MVTVGTGISIFSKQKKYEIESYSKKIYGTAGTISKFGMDFIKKNFKYFCKAP